MDSPIKFSKTMFASFALALTGFHSKSAGTSWARIRYDVPGVMRQYSKTAAAAALTALVILAAGIISGCARKEESRISVLGQEAILRREGERSRIELSGGEVIDITPAEVLSKLMVPVYPGAKIVEGTQLAAVMQNTGEKSYMAKYHAQDDFDKIIRWYEAQMDQKAVRAKVIETRYALVSAKQNDGKDTRTAIITCGKNKSSCEIHLIRLILKKETGK